MKIVIIGGNAAGLTAASRAKRLDPRLDVTVLEKGPHISYSTCGIPYYLAKLVGESDLDDAHLSSEGDSLASFLDAIAHQRDPYAARRWSCSSRRRARAVSGAIRF